MPLTLVLLIDRMKRFPMPICWTTHKCGEEEHRQILRSSIMRTLPPTQGDWAAWWIWNLKQTWHEVAFLTICIWTGWERCYHSCMKPPTTDSARLYGQCLTIKQVPGIQYLKSINKSTSLKQKTTCSNTCVMTVYNEHVGILSHSRHNSSENEDCLTGSTYTTTTHQQKTVTIQIQKTCVYTWAYTCILQRRSDFRNWQHLQFTRRPSSGLIINECSCWWFFVCSSTLAVS